MLTSTYIQHSCTVNEHRFTVPLDHHAPHNDDAATIEIFAREIIKPGGKDLPYAVYMQGGPGGKSPRPGNFLDGFIGRLVQDYRVVLLDQRGTGQSHRLDSLSLSEFTDNQALADYLTLFRQDQIVLDAEWVRKDLAGDQPWLSLGQSYGGFINTCYLSTAPHGLSGVLNTGGLPGLTHIDDIYRLTYQRTAQRNQTYCERYPRDEQTIREVCAHLNAADERLPTGERLSAQRFRMVGLSLGMERSFDTLHYLLEGPFTHIKGERRLSQEFLAETAQHISLTPMYAVLHESIYAGALNHLSQTSTNWSADRLAHEIPGFHPDADPLDYSEPYYLTGEHMFRAFFDEDPALKPLAAATDLLAKHTQWRPVYDLDVLARNEVPVASAVFFDDMFVPRELSLDAADAIKGSHVWITNEYQHDGIGASGGEAVTRLLSLMKD